MDLNVSRNESSKFSKIHEGAPAAAEEWHLIISTCTTQKIVRCRTVDLSSVAWAEEGDCVRVDWLGNLICLRGCVLPIFFLLCPLAAERGGEEAVRNGGASGHGRGEGKLSFK